MTMNIRRFTGSNSRDALRQVREALGDDAVVLSTQPAGQGVEVMAMAPESVGRLAQMARATETGRRVEPQTAAPVAVGTASALSAMDAQAARRKRFETPVEPASVDDDVTQLQMSTLSFQDYVRQRMLKRRQAAMAGRNAAESVDADDAADDFRAEVAPTRGGRLDVRVDDRLDDRLDASGLPHDDLHDVDAPAVPPAGSRRAEPSSGRADAHRSLPYGDDSIHVPGLVADAAFDVPAMRQNDLLAELRSMKGLIEERFGALAFMERLQRRPVEARLTQKLLDCGFSPLLVRKLTAGLGAEVSDETAWAARILERNLQTDENGSAIEDQAGVFALIGATGVGKTTTTAKLAAAFATRHGAAHLGLITLDAYRVGAHEQLRAYGRILGVPVHTAHDRASLEDLLELLSAKKLVLIDTAGMAQRDARTRELLDMLSHSRIQRLLVVNAASQGETIDDVIVAYRAATCAGVVLSKIDEAVKLGPALDAAIRHKLKVVGVANGQRVPEDWHRLPASALVERAMRGGGSSAYRLEASEMNLVFATPQGTEPHGARSA